MNSLIYGLAVANVGISTQTKTIASTLMLTSPLTLHYVEFIAKIRVEIEIEYL